MRCVSASEQDTFELGRQIGEKLVGGEIIVLSGELGAGKTVFTKGVASGLGICDTIVSPTFNIMNEYSGRLKLYHYDAYRLGSAAEAVEAGLCEYFGESDAVCVLEWAENIAEALKGYSVTRVTITYNDENVRTLEIVDE